jgi:hypothetical protein
MRAATAGRRVAEPVVSPHRYHADANPDPTDADPSTNHTGPSTGPTDTDTHPPGANTDDQRLRQSQGDFIAISHPPGANSHAGIQPRRHADANKHHRDGQPIRDGSSDQDP